MWGSIYYYAIECRPSKIYKNKFIFPQPSKIQITNLDDFHITAAINVTGIDYPSKAPKCNLFIDPLFSV